MIMRIDYVPGRRRLVAATRRVGRRAMLRTRSVGALAAVAAVVALLTDDPAFTVGWTALAVCGLWLFPLRSIRRAVRTSWYRFSTPGTGEISDHGIRRVTEKLDTLFRWEAVMDVEAMPDQLIFRLNKAQFLPVTTADLSAEQRDELISHLRGRGLVFRGARPRGGTPARAAA